MGRVKITAAIELFLAGAVSLLLILPACRKEGVPLDRNRAPETYITSSPTETTATDYRVHMHWYGRDEDGVVQKYIWYVSDTLLTLEPEDNPAAEALDWNPEERIVDYLRGRFTTKTDTVIIFKGYNERTTAQVNNQSFHIAAVDDGGKIDPSPARLQFRARVRGIPTVKFWTNLGSGDKPYVPGVLDTISMFVPFIIRFNATTINNVITGYQWIYNDITFPQDSLGNPLWLIPTSQSQVVSVALQEPGDMMFSSGLFAFKVRARDEAGAISKADLLSGQGVCQVMVNHDPDTRVHTACQVFFKPQSSGALESLTVNFLDDIPDTLPDSSLVRFFYWGWDDPKDRDHLQYNNPTRPIRFQFAYQRWAISEEGKPVGNKTSPWYPLKAPEDTNPNAGVADEDRDRDSTTMRVGTFQYNFYVRSYDEQNRADGTPAVVGFVGNFPPTVDSLRTGFWDRPGSSPSLRTYHPTTNDTIVVGWNGSPFVSRGDTLCPYEIKVAGTDPNKTLTRSFRFTMRGGGHDDRRDPPGAGIKGWRYRITDPDENYAYAKENEWQFTFPLNRFEQEVGFSITVPFPPTPEAQAHIVDSLLNNPPAFLGAQEIELTGMDDKDTENFGEGIRGNSPEFDEFGNKIPGNNWIVNEYYIASFARRDTRRIPLYLKFVK